VDNIRSLLETMVATAASDLHIKAGMPPGFRIHGQLKAVDGLESLTSEASQALAYQLLTPEQIEVFEHDHDLDFSKGFPGLARFRVNVFRQRGSVGAVLRVIPIEIPRIEDMGFPDVIRQMCGKPRGLVLVTGPTGSGKSTTLAAMVDYLNRTEHGHILTLEDPLEFAHRDKLCYVSQREIGTDSRSFAAALRAALREDPDYILVGEMRDLETIALAITAAETGHLVFGTLHTTSAVQTVDRVVDVFPHAAQQQVRAQLSVTLQGVISQTLLPKIGGGRICAQEIMVGTDAARSLIREGKTPQLINVLQTGAQAGMQTLESHLAQLVVEGKVTAENAIAKANNPMAVRQSLERSGHVAPEAGSGPTPTPAAPATEKAPTEPGRSASDSQETRGGELDDFERFRSRRRERV
jgi:twitching motility protein PilT